MTPLSWCPRLVAPFLGMIFMPSLTAWAESPDGVDKKQVIEAIRFEGVKDLDAEAMRSKLGLKEKGIYDEDTLNADVTIIENSLRDQGYPYVRIQKVRGKLGEDGRLILTFVMEYGDLCHIAEVKLAGNKAFTSREIAPKTHTTVGKIYSHSDLNADEKMIIGFYGARGYADATVEISLMEVARNSLRIQYEITEGKEYQFQAIHISGNAHVKEEVIRKEFKIAPGDIFNTALIERGRQALLRTGLFETVDVSSTKAAKPGFKNLEVTVVEK